MVISMPSLAHQLSLLFGTIEKQRIWALGTENGLKQIAENNRCFDDYVVFLFVLANNDLGKFVGEIAKVKKKMTLELLSSRI